MKPSEDSPAAEAAPKRNRQRERSEASTGRLLTAAAQLFAERGYRNTTLADIGERAGYSHGLVSRRFGSKHSLLVALLDRTIDAWMKTQFLPSLADQTGLAGIRVYLDASCVNAVENGDDLRALESLMFEGLWGEPELKDRLSAVQRHSFERLHDLLEGGARKGEIRTDIDPGRVAWLGSLALRGVTYRWLLEEEFDFCAALNEFGDVMEILLKLNPA